MTTADTNVIARAGTAGRAPLGLGSFGVWMTSQAASPELAIAVERLGYGAIWLGSADGDLRLAEKLLEATSTLTVATGIVNIWTYPPGPVGAAWHRVEQTHPGRLLLGIGVGHREVTGASYARPYQALTGYLDTLDMVGVPASRRVRPRSARRCCGCPRNAAPERTRTWSLPSTSAEPAESSATGRCWHPSRKSCSTPTRPADANWPASKCCFT